MNPSAGGHYQGQHDLVAAGSIVEADLHRIEMTAHVGGVDMGDGDIEARAWPADFFCGGYDGFGSAEHLAHGVTAGHVPQSAVLDFSCRSDDRSLAVTLDKFRVAAECCDQSSRHFEAER